MISNTFVFPLILQINFFHWITVILANNQCVLTSALKLGNNHVSYLMFYYFSLLCIPLCFLIILLFTIFSRRNVCIWGDKLSGKKLLRPQHVARSGTTPAPQPTGPSRRPGLRLSTCNRELLTAATVQPAAPGFCTLPLWPMGGCSSPQPTRDPGQKGALRWVWAVAIRTLSVLAWTWSSSEDKSPLFKPRGWNINNQRKSRWLSARCCGWK